jgi:hypothetical protein
VIRLDRDPTTPRPALGAPRSRSLGILPAAPADATALVSSTLITTTATTATLIAIALAGVATMIATPSRDGALLALVALVAALLAGLVAASGLAGTDLVGAGLLAVVRGAQRDLAAAAVAAWATARQAWQALAILARAALVASDVASAPALRGSTHGPPGGREARPRRRSVTGRAAARRGGAPWAPAASATRRRLAPTPATSARAIAA